MKIVVFFLLLLIIAAGCVEDSCVCPETTDLKIGVLIPKTGSASVTGANMGAALEIALSEINTYFQDLGSNKRIQLIIEDTRGDTAVALSKLQSLHEQGVIIVIGPYSSAELLELKSYADSVGMILISPSSTATSLAISGDNVFRFVPNDEYQGKAMAKLLSTDGITRIIAIIRDDVWGNDLLNSTKGYYNAAGGFTDDIIKYNPTAMDESQIAESVDALSQTYPSDNIGIYLISFGEGTRILNKASSYSNLEAVKWYGSSAFAQNSALLADTTAMGFCIQTDFSCPVYALEASAADKWQSLSAAIKSRTGNEPEIYAFTAYDALWIAALTLLNRQEYLDDISKMKTKLVETASSYYGATGRVLLNSAGDRAGGNYDFWGISKDTSEYSWTRVAFYDYERDEIIR